MEGEIGEGSGLVTGPTRGFLAEKKGRRADLALAALAAARLTRREASFRPSSMFRFSTPPLAHTRLRLVRSGGEGTFLRTRWRLWSSCVDMALRTKSGA